MKPGVVVGALVVLALLGTAFVVYNTVTGSGSITTWLAKNYVPADDATTRAATDKEAAAAASLNGTGTGAVKALTPDTIYVSTAGVTETADIITDKFEPNDLQTRDGRTFLEYEDAVVAVVPALSGTGALVFLDKGDAGYRRWGSYTGAVWGTSRAGRSFSGGGGGSGGGRGGGSGGGK